MISDTLIQRLDNARLLVAFTGAGVSAESGVATFRAADGLWSKFRPEELANVDAFMRNPQLVWEWYQARREVIVNARPNAGHAGIAELEELIPQVSVVTQNIDGLHREAGSTEVIELHGNIRKNFCQRCRTRYDDPEFLTAPEVGACPCGGMIRPDVVWFGEMLPVDALELAERRAREAGVLLSIGTSSLVYPAAQLPLIAREYGAYVVEINPEETPLSGYVHERIAAPSGTAIPAIISRLRAFRNGS